MSLFKELENLLIAIPVLIASLTSLIHKITLALGNYKRKRNGGDLHQKQDRVLDEVVKNTKRIDRVEKILIEIKTDLAINKALEKDRKKRGQNG